MLTLKFGRSVDLRPNPEDSPYVAKLRRAFALVTPHYRDECLPTDVRACVAMRDLEAAGISLVTLVYAVEFFTGRKVSATQFRGTYGEACLYITA